MAGLAKCDERRNNGYNGIPYREYAGWVFKGCTAQPRHTDVDTCFPSRFSFSDLWSISQCCEDVTGRGQLSARQVGYCFAVDSCG
jgi:hypothetical protein